MHRPRGPMDKASDFESEDCGFDPHRGQFCNASHLHRDVVWTPWSSNVVWMMAGIVGSVVEFSPATRETGVRFPDNADFFLGKIIFEVLKIDLPYIPRIVGSVVEFSPATRETGVRFPDNATFWSSLLWSVFKIIQTLRVGFEPTREDPIWFRVKRLNHSAIAASRFARNYLI